MISPQTIEQIKSRIDILDVIGDYVKFKKRGANYLGLCPFHNEKSPSFTVSPAKELYKCFGCGKSGNTITFLMEHDKLSYVEALKWLATRYHIEIEETISTPEQKQLQLVSDSLYIINSFAAKFFQERLTESEEGRTIALSYLQERGFKEDIVRKFQLGYNPNQRDELAKALIQHQFNRELLPKTGLVTIRNEVDLVDNYRGRIIFPIHAITGKIVGFGARVIGKVDNAPKYINTPENDIYVKSKILYGIYFARTAIDKADECLLVEGYTDVVSLHQAGVENVVASGGTSLTVDQLRLIRKYSNNLTIIYDGDAAGVKAALRGLDMAIEEGLNVKLVLIPDKEDPDSYVNKVGAEAFKDFIQTNKKDFILFQLEVSLKEVGNDVSRRSAVVNQIAETLSKINRAEDFTRQQDYIKQCAALLKIEETGFTTLINKYKRDKIEKEERKQSNEIPPPEQPENVATATEYLVNKDEAIERNLIRALLEHGLKPFDENITMAHYIHTELESFHFDNAQLNQIYQEYFDLYNEGLLPTANSFTYHSNVEIQQVVTSITIKPYELSQKWDEVLEGMNIVNRDVSKEDVLMSVCYFKLRKLKTMIDTNQADMENAPLEKQLDLIKLHSHLKTMEKELTQKIGTVILK